MLRRLKEVEPGGRKTSHNESVRSWYSLNQDQNGVLGLEKAGSLPYCQSWAGPFFPLSAWDTLVSLDRPVSLDLAIRTGSTGFFSQAPALVLGFSFWFSATWVSQSPAPRHPFFYSLITCSLVPGPLSSFYRFKFPFQLSPKSLDVMVIQKAPF